MNMSPDISEIAPAFLKAQAEMGSAEKNQINPFYKSKYADLSSIIDACKSALNNNAIMVLQPIDGMTVETILIHSSGQWFSSSTPIVAKALNDPQALGSAITYACRYALQSICTIPREDDDGNQATIESSDAVKKQVLGILTRLEVDESIIPKLTQHKFKKEPESITTQEWQQLRSMLASKQGESKFKEWVSTQ